MDTTSPSVRGDSGWSLSLRNWRVRSKLIAVLVIPAVAFLVLASFGIGSSVANAQAFRNGSRQAELGRQVTAVVHELQSERDLSIGFIESRDEKIGRALAAQQRAVDQAISAYREAETDRYADFSQLREKFDAVRAALDDVPGLREAVRSSSLTERATFDEYSQTISTLLDVNSDISEPVGDEDFTQAVGALNDLSRAKELTSQVRGTLYAIAFRNQFSFGGFQDFSDLLAQQREAIDQFQADANEQQRRLFADVVQGQAVLAVNRIEQRVLNRQASSNLEIEPEQWLNASTTQMELLRAVEARLLDGVIQQSRNLSTSAQRDALRDALLIAVILAVALLALFAVARSMARPLQRLRAGAMEIAEHRLPDAVHRLRTTEAGNLDVRVEPLGLRSKDEIGQVAQAVDAIQEVAVRLATEQAALRRSIGDMFTNLARRSQTLIDRQLELIDDLERNETDPETLEHLFRLDHLATRMRRNAEDLIVLSDADPGRHWVQPMTVVDVVRAAAAEVEEYQRVEFLPLANVEVAGHVAVDVIHLLAELIENATSFSPPNTKVQIAGQAVPHGYVIEIEDRGLGMSDEELIQANERLSNPPEIDFALSRVLGLYVVGRLAMRHGIKVQLRHSWYGGVTALTLLPHGLLMWPKGPQAIAEPAGAASLPSRAELPSPAPAAEPALAQPGDGTPIFEAARSDWFVTEPSEPGPLPHRQRQQRGPAPDGNNGAPAPARPTSRPAEPPSQPAPSPPPPVPDPLATEQPVPSRPSARGADDESPLYQAERTRLRERPPVEEPAYAPRHAQPSTAPLAEPAPSTQARTPPAPDSAAPLTQAGLPRRVPRANLAPGMAADQPRGPQPPASPPPGRTPDEVRSMLSSYRTGIERGRTAAGGSEPGERPPDAP